MTDKQPEAKKLVLDPNAAAASADRPAFLSRPPGAPVYYGFRSFPKPRSMAGATARSALFENGQPVVLLKLNNAIVEANVWLTVDAAHALHRVSTLSDDADALRFGKCANSQVHWGRDGENHVYLLIGNDDQTWDVGITLSELTFSTIINEIESHLKNERMQPPEKP